MDRQGSFFQNRFGLYKKVIYIISTGDTCRSPMAGGYLCKLLDERNIKNVEVRCAGVLTVTGLKASQEARQIMESEEVELDRHRSCQLSPDMIRRADLILGMTPYHVQKAVRISEEARGKTFLLQEYTGADLKNIQIQDPMGCTLEIFKKRFNEIRAGCDKLMETSFIVDMLAGKARVSTPKKLSKTVPSTQLKPAPKKPKTKAAAPESKANETKKTKKTAAKGKKKKAAAGRKAATTAKKRPAGKKKSRVTKKTRAKTSRTAASTKTSAGARGSKAAAKGKKSTRSKTASAKAAARSKAAKKSAKKGAAVVAKSRATRSSTRGRATSSAGRSRSKLAAKRKA